MRWNAPSCSAGPLCNLDESFFSVITCILSPDRPKGMHLLKMGRENESRPLVAVSSTFERNRINFSVCLYLKMTSQSIKGWWIWSNLYFSTTMSSKFSFGQWRFSIRCEKLKLIFHLKFAVDNVPQRVNSDDLLTFSVAPPSGQVVNFLHSIPPNILAILGFHWLSEIMLP